MKWPGSCLLYTSGISALKLAIAYDRGLSFKQVTRTKAEVAFYRKAGEETPEEIANFQDFIFHYSFQKAEELGLPIQIHTGPGKAFQTAPSLLGPILEEYRTVKVSPVSYTHLITFSRWCSPMMDKSSSKVSMSLC